MLFSSNSVGMFFGYCVVVNRDPMLIIKMDTPSTFHANFSPTIIGDSIAVNIIEKHDVDDIKIIFPNHIETIKKELEKRTSQLTCVAS